LVTQQGSHIDEVLRVAREVEIEERALVVPAQLEADGVLVVVSGHALSGLVHGGKRVAAVAPAKSDAAKGKWIKGWVSDSKCGAKGAGLGHEACGNKCLQAGEHVVFVDDIKHKVLNVDNQDALKDHMGHRVAVQGALDEAAGTIHVNKVNMITQGSKKAEAASMDEMHK